jgi:ribonuclease HI
VAEAVAAREGLELAAQLGLTKVILESDSAVLVAALTSEIADRSIIVGLCQDIQELRMVFSSFKVHFVCRQANFLADRCVKEVSSESPFKVWLNCLPNWLEEAAALDCNPVLN